MSRIDYEFDRSDAGKSRAGIYFRLGGIFLLVAGLTAGIVWLLVPKTGNDAKTPPPAPKTEVTAPAGESETPLPATPAPATKETAPAAETPLPAAETETLPKTEPLTPEEPPTLLPEKGKPWVGDPVVDRPDVPKAEIPADVRPALDADFRQAEQALKAKDVPAAAAAAGKILGSAGMVPYSTEWRRAAALLTEANLAAFAARDAVAGQTEWYTARPGDSYSRIASRFHTTIEALKHYNRIAENDNMLRVSQRLLLAPGAWKIVIRKGARLLELYRRNRLYAVFDVGIGRLGKTPSADFVISSKLKDPDWYTPGGGVVRHGDPDNPLGTRFLKLAPTGSPNRPLLGYGIHGTRDDSDITRSLSNGCIRMRNADVEILYIIVPAKTPVEITE